MLSRNRSDSKQCGDIVCGRSVFYGNSLATRDDPFSNQTDEEPAETNKEPFISTVSFRGPEHEGAGSHYSNSSSAVEREELEREELERAMSGMTLKSKSRCELVWGFTQSCCTDHGALGYSVIFQCPNSIVPSCALLVLSAVLTMGLARYLDTATDRCVIEHASDFSCVYDSICVRGSVCVQVWRRACGRAQFYYR